MLRKVAELRRAVGWPAMTAATVLLSLTALCMLALTLATWQPDNNPRWVLYVLVVVALGGLAWTVRRGALLEPREVAAMVSLCFVALAVLTWGTERQVAVLANGTSTPTLAVFAVWFLPLALARVVSYVGTALWVLAVASHHDPQMLGPTVAVVVQVLVGTEVLGRLRLRLDRLARTDQLTGALNRWGVQAVVDAQLVRRRRLGTPLTVLALDVDDLRAVNTLGGRSSTSRARTVSGVPSRRRRTSCASTTASPTSSRGGCRWVLRHRGRAGWRRRVPTTTSRRCSRGPTTGCTRRSRGVDRSRVRPE